MEINRDDYFNGFNPAKSYRKLLFIAGRPLQSAELNQMQDLILDLLSRLGKHLVSNGTIISGGEVTSLSPTSISMNAGVVSIDGVPTQVEASTVVLPETGIAVLGVAVKSIMITGNDDPSIFEPDTQSPHYGQDGAYREKIVAVWKLSTQVGGDEVMFPVMTITEGTILSTSASTDTNSPINNAISVYDNGVHGSYVVNGLVLNNHGISSVDNSIELTMSSGVARVTGSERPFPVESIVALAPVDDTKVVLSEPIVFVTGTLTYPLRNTPLMAITKVSGTKKITHNVTRGPSSGGTDLLTNTPVLKINAVTQGGTTYVKDVDFKQLGDSIDWSLSGAEPSPGSTYSVTYEYIANFSATFSGSNLVIAQVDGDALVSNSTLYVDYAFYLSRIDRILLGKTGDVIVAKGVPGLPAYIQPPGIPGGGFLSLATVTLAKGVDPKIEQTTTVYMVPFSEIKEMANRIGDMEYNIAQLSLKDSAQSMDPVTVKRGVIVDSLLNNNLRDAGIPQTALVIGQRLRVPSLMSAYKANTTDVFKLNVQSEYEVFSNILRTKSQRINPYAGDGLPPQAGMALAPQLLAQSITIWWSASAASALTAARTTTVSVSLFNAGETINFYFRGALVATGVANAQGKLSKTITIPAGTASGSYEVSAKGVTSKAEARSVLSVNVSITRVWPSHDPIAQTFVANGNHDISALSVVLTELPSNSLEIKLVPVSLGIPDSTKVLAIGRIPKSACVLGWNKIPFDVPHRVFEGQEYAVIVATGNYQGQVATAQVGKYDTTNAVWVNNQALNGVLLLSANERTWTPVQDEDLTMRLHAVKYVTTKSVKVLDMTDAPNNATEFAVVADLDLPAGTSCTFSLKVAGVSYDLANGAEITSVPPIPSSSGAIELWVTMNSNDPGLSPKVLEGVSLYAGVLENPGSYVQRSFAIPNGSTTPAKITVVMDVYAPSGATVVPSYQNGSSAWVALTPTNSVEIGDGVRTITYTASNVAQNSSRLKVELNGTYAARPWVSNIRTLLS